MKTLMLKMGIPAIVMLLVIPALNSCSKTNDENAQPQPIENSDVSAIEKDGLILSDEEAILFMREEEKLARDVYLYLFAKWDHVVFDNISKSEQRHMDEVLALIIHFGLDDPALGVGEFSDPELQALYDELTSMGETSLEDAMFVGATIEDLDIWDLETFIEEAEDEFVQCVFENLMRGSRNHLRAFVRHLDMLDVTYAPQYISQEEFDDIIEGSHEPHGTPCKF